MENLKIVADTARVLSAEMVTKAGSGHPGMPLGMADIAVALYGEVARYSAEQPDWPNRDRIVFSNGHGSALLYSLLHMAGYSDFTMKELKNFRQLGSKTAGHPEYGLAKGVEMTTGPLGQGVATAVGMAMAERLLSKQLGSELVDHYTYALLGDGCLMEGVGQEAISLAGHYKLSKLILLFDDNGITIDGSTSLAFSENIPARFEAAGWQVLEGDGQSVTQMREKLNEAKKSNRPTLIMCKTTIGYGAENQGSESVHGAPLKPEGIDFLRKSLDYTAPPFTLPNEVAEYWAAVKERGTNAYNEWKIVFDALPCEKKALWNQYYNFDITSLDSHFGKLKEELFHSGEKLAGRQSSEKVINMLDPLMPSLISGSADLTHSCLNKAKTASSVTPNDFSGKYIHWGVREHSMSAAINGLSLHGGLLPVGSTFLCFSDYSRPALRLAALMKIQVIQLFTHDSILMGEDGPTHQPVEQIAALRAIPNLYLFRPADAVEVVESWQVALSIKKAPSLLILTRQSLGLSSSTGKRENLVAKGGYVIAQTDSQKRRDVTLMATGSEVKLALKTAEKLAEKGLCSAVVSLPCHELFDKQEESYREQVLGDAPRFAIEAASTFGWAKYTESSDNLFGIDCFGESAPGAEVYNHFGFSETAIAEKIVEKLS